MIENNENNQKERIAEAVLGICKADLAAEKKKDIPNERKRADALKEKQIRNAVTSFAAGCRTEDIAILCDLTIMASGKKGILFSTEGMYYSDLNFMRKKDPLAQPVKYAELRDVETSRDDVWLIYRDGRREKAYGSIYAAFIAEALRRILAVTGVTQQPAWENRSAEEPRPSAEEAYARKKAACCLCQAAALLMETRMLEETNTYAKTEAEAAEPSASELKIPETETLEPNELPVYSEKNIPETDAGEHPVPTEILDNIITLHDDAGNEIRMEFLDLIRYQEKDYVVLLPVDAEEDDGTVVILQLETPEDSEEEYYLAAEDDVLEPVFELFRERFKNEFTFSDQEKKTEQTANATPIPYRGTEPYIFISYAHRDSETVWKIIRRLQADGFRVWYDEGIDPGTEWDDNIASHIENSGCVLAFISENYLKSENCRDEINYARDLSINRLLIYLEDVKLTGGMAMRMNRLQAIYYCNYQIKEIFFRRLYESRVLKENSLRDL